jgi:hypothetical protein
MIAAGSAIKRSFEPDILGAVREEIIELKGAPRHWRAREGGSGADCVGGSAVVFQSNGVRLRQRAVRAL